MLSAFLIFILQDFFLKNTFKTPILFFKRYHSKVYSFADCYGGDIYYSLTEMLLPRNQLAKFHR